MIKNNVISLVVHIAVSLVVYFGITEVGLEEHKAIHILVLFIYILLGYTLMNNTKSLFKDYISVASVAIVGIIIWSFCLISTDYGQAGPWYRATWLIYFEYVYPVFIFTMPIQYLLTKAYNINDMWQDIISIYMTLIPSLLFWVGMLLKQSKRKYSKSI